MLSHSPSIVTNGLVLHLDAASPKSYPRTGTTWFDRSANGNNGTLTNGPTFSSANSGGIVFDGINDVVIVNNSPTINPSSAITVSAFFKISSYGSNYAPICIKQNNYTGSYEQYSIFFTNTGAGFTITGVDRIQKSLASNLDYRNKFVHLVGVCDTISDEMKLYINGTLIATTSFTSTFDISTNPLRIGSIEGSYPGFANGNIYNVLIYNRVLALQEIQQNFNAAKSRFNL